MDHYCEFCETTTPIKKEHHCSVCYKSSCESCYFNIIYEDELCQECFNDMNTNIKVNKRIKFDENF